MTPRTGRPKIEKPRTIQYSIRLDTETEKKLVEYCKKNNITKAEVIRNGIEMILGIKKSAE